MSSFFLNTPCPAPTLSIPARPRSIQYRSRSNAYPGNSTRRLFSSPFTFSHSTSTPITHSFPTARLISSSSPFLSRQRPHHSRPFDPFRHPRHPAQRLPRPHFQQHPALHTPQHFLHSFTPPYSLSHLPPPVDALSHLCSTGPSSRHVRDVSDLRLSHLHFPRIPAHRSRRPLHHP